MLTFSKLNFKNKRYFSTLKEVLAEKIPIERKKINELKKNFGNTIIDKVTVNQIISGSRDIKSIYWEPSLLDANDGIKIRNKSIEDCKKLLPSFKKNGEMIPEAMFWLLITGDIPSEKQIESLRKDLYKRSYLPNHVEFYLRNLPRDIHPMNSLSTALMLCQTSSQFKKNYGIIPKDKYWETTYNDILDIIAKLPLIASRIYRYKYHNDYRRIPINSNLDYSGNFCQMMGFDNKDFHELIRLYLSIHCDHEGGNASAHTGHLVSSTLADPYISYASALNALSGPLHGSANSEVLKWIIELKNELNKNNLEINKTNIEKFVNKTLDNGQVIPGYGHAVLRVTDPRYECQRDFALKYLPDDDLFLILENLYKTVPEILKKRGKVSNPYPNVDSHSGVLLSYYSMTEYEYYTVLFGVSRSLGVLSQIFWDRALNLPIERPKSVNYDYIINSIK